MAFLRAATGQFRAKTRYPAGSGQAAPPEASLGAMGPTLDISGLLHRVPGVVSVELGALPATQRSDPFPVDPTCQPVSHPARGRVPGKNQGPGAGNRGRPRFRARWGGPGEAGPTPWDPVSRGVSGL